MAAKVSSMSSARKVEETCDQNDKEHKQLSKKHKHIQYCYLPITFENTDWQKCSAETTIVPVYKANLFNAEAMKRVLTELINAYMTKLIKNHTRKNADEPIYALIKQSFEVLKIDLAIIAKIISLSLGHLLTDTYYYTL